MSVDAELISLTEDVEIGLGCPDGTVIWPPETYHGFEFNTPEQRNTFASVLVEAARSMNVEPNGFARSFHWVPRSRTTIVLSKIAERVLDMGVTFEVTVDPEATDDEPTPQ